MKKLTQEDFIERAVSVHGDRYCYDDVVYTNNSTKVKIICPIHGVFEQSPNKHMNGQGCRICGFDKTSSIKRKSSDEFISQSKHIHGNRYCYDKVIYKNRNTKVIIICDVHGEFEQRAANHLNGWGCNQCGYDKSKEKQTLNHKDVIDEAINIHGDRYDYSLSLYTAKKDKIKIICSEHGVFEQRPDNHLYGQGCPKCSSLVSQHEIELQEWLSQHIDIKCNDRSIIHPFELDIVIPSKNIAIEYNGLYWHCEDAGKDKYYHINKFNMCKEKGYRLIQIWENEWLLHKDIIKSMILNTINQHHTKIHGRKCIISTVPSPDARTFYDDNHIQGFQGGCHKGLYHNNELVSLMTMSYYGDYTMLERFVNKRNHLVHGSFSKLLKSFNISNDIVTFADVRHFTGGVYEGNGFDYIHTTRPNYWYFKNSSIDIIHRRSFQKKKIKERCIRGEMVYDDSLTEYQNMRENKYHRIWDCGNIKYVLRR
jgi:very-short-patch-repair endonuclease